MTHDRSTESSSKHAGGIGRSFGRGAAFLSIGAVASRFASFLSQIVLGAVLTKEQFGIFGVALGVLAVTGCLRGGVVHQYLQTLNPKRFNSEAGPYVRLAGYASAIGAVATAIAAILVPSWMSEPALRSVLIVLAVNALTPFFNSPLRARMQVEMRFGTMTAVDSINAVLRTVVAVTLAYAGAGALALAVPLLASAMFEGIVFRIMLRLRIFSLARSPGRLDEAFRTVRWTILLAIASTTVYQGDYLASSLFAPAAVVGVYYFAYGLCNQSALVAGSMLGEVVAPATAKLRSDPARLAAAVLRIARGLGLLIPGLVFVIPVIFPEVDYLVWKGRWHEASAITFALSLQVTILLITTLLYSTRQGQGDFRSPAILECIRGAAVMLGAGLGAYLSPTPFGIATGVLALGGTTSLVVGAWMIRSMGVSGPRAVMVMLGGPLAACGLAIALRYGMDHVQGWSGAGEAHRWRWAIEILAGAVSFFALYAVIVRLFFHHSLRDMIGIAPARLARLLRFLG